MSIVVSKTIFSAMKRDIEKKRKKVANEVAALKEMEKTFSQMKVAKLSRR